MCFKDDDFGFDEQIQQFTERNSVYLEGGGCYIKKIRPIKWYDRRWGAVFNKRKKNNGTLMVVDYSSNPFVKFSFEFSGNVNIIRTCVNIHNKRIYMQIEPNYEKTNYYKIVFSGGNISLVHKKHIS